MEWHDFRKERPTKDDDYLIKKKVPIISGYTYRIERWQTRWQVWSGSDFRNVVAWAEVPKCDIE